MNEKNKVLVVEDDSHYSNEAIQLLGRNIILANDYNSVCHSYNGFLEKRHHEIKVVVTDLCLGGSAFNPLRMDNSEREIINLYNFTIENHFRKTGRHMIYEMLKAGVNDEMEVGGYLSQKEWAEDMKFQIQNGCCAIESEIASWIFGDRMGWPFGYLIAKRAEKLNIPVAIITTGGHHGCQWIPLLYAHLGGNNKEYLNRLIEINAESEKVVGRETNGKYETVGNILITHCHEKTQKMWKKAMEIAK